MKPDSNRTLSSASLYTVSANEVRHAYNRAEYLTERVRMMQHWAD